MTKRLITDKIVVFLLDDLNFENKFEFVIKISLKKNSYVYYLITKTIEYQKI